MCLCPRACPIPLHRLLYFQCYSAHCLATAGCPAAVRFLCYLHHLRLLPVVAVHFLCYLHYLRLLPMVAVHFPCYLHYLYLLPVAAVHFLCFLHYLCLLPMAAVRFLYCLHFLCLLPVAAVHFLLPVGHHFRLRHLLLLLHRTHRQNPVPWNPEGSHLHPHPCHSVPFARKRNCRIRYLAASCLPIQI